MIIVTFYGKGYFWLIMQAAMHKYFVYKRILMIIMSKSCFCTTSITQELFVCFLFDNLCVFFSYFVFLLYPRILRPNAITSFLPQVPLQCDHQNFTINLIFYYNLPILFSIFYEFFVSLISVKISSIKLDTQSHTKYCLKLLRCILTKWMCQ